MYFLNFLKDQLGKKLAQRSLNNPIFIVGTGRSGTSILLQALGKHPDIISFLGEAPFLTSIGGNASLFCSENAEFYCSSLKTDIHYFYHTLSRLGLEVAGGEHYALKRHIEAFHYNKYHCKTHWCTKTFPTENVTQGLLKVYPNAKFLYIVRNGIDVVNSMTKFHGFRDREFTNHCHVWRDSINKYRYLTLHKDALFLKHEDLISDPDIFFSSIYNHLDLKASQLCIDFTKNNIVHPLDQPNQNKQNAILQLKNRQSPFKSWTTDQQQTFISICSEAMNELHYPIC